MNIRKHHTDHPERAVDEVAFDEREWQVQERALQAERNGAATGGDDALAAPYRAVSRALRQPPVGRLPLDFAASVARQAVAARAAGEERFERMLTQALIALLGLCAGVVSVLYGPQWLHAIGSAVPSGAGPWVGVLAACAGMHWLLGRWHEHQAAH